MVSTARNLHRYVEYTMYSIYDFIFIIKKWSSIYKEIIGVTLSKVNLEVHQI